MRLPQRPRHVETRVLLRQVPRRERNGFRQSAGGLHMPWRNPSDPLPKSFQSPASFASQSAACLHMPALSLLSKVSKSLWDASLSCVPFCWAYAAQSFLLRHCLKFSLDPQHPLWQCGRWIHILSILKAHERSCRLSYGSASFPRVSHLRHREGERREIQLHFLHFRSPWSSLWKPSYDNFPQELQAPLFSPLSVLGITFFFHTKHVWQ